MIRSHLGLVPPAFLPYLPGSLLRATHLVCCSLRGKCWGSQAHKLRFVSLHGWTRLHAYHVRVLQEMQSRGYQAAPRWWYPAYRGRKLSPWPTEARQRVPGDMGYPEHDSASYRESLDLLRKRAPGAKWTQEDMHRLHTAPEGI